MDRTHFIACRDIRLAYMAAGTAPAIGSSRGPTLVFVHGWGASKSIWRPSLEHFASQRRCLALDLPGHGESDRLTGGYSPPAMASILLEALERLDVGPAVLVGHSLGAVVALAATLEQPRAVVGQVLVAPPDPATIRRTVRLLADDQVALAAMRVLRRGYGTIGRWAPVRGGSRVGAFLRRAQATGLADEVALMAAARAVAATDLQAQLATIRVPTLVIAGALDFTASPAGARAIAGAIPTARLVEFPATGHHPMDERPGRFRRTVEYWLDEIAAAADAPAHTMAGEQR